MCSWQQNISLLAEGEKNKNSDKTFKIAYHNMQLKGRLHEASSILSSPVWGWVGPCITISMNENLHSLLPTKDVVDAVWPRIGGNIFEVLAT